MTKQQDLLMDTLVQNPGFHLDQAVKEKASNSLTTDSPTNNVHRLQLSRYPMPASSFADYPLREPRPGDEAGDAAGENISADPSPIAPIDAGASPLGQTIDIYDELSKVNSLRFFFYDAIEGMFEQEEGCIGSGHWTQSYPGMLLFLGWLREQDKKVKDDLETLIQSLRPAKEEK